MQPRRSRMCADLLERLSAAWFPILFAAAWPTPASAYATLAHTATRATLRAASGIPASWDQPRRALSGPAARAPQLAATPPADACHARDQRAAFPCAH